MCQTGWFKGTIGRLKSGYFTVLKYFWFILMTRSVLWRLCITPFDMHSGCHKRQKVDNRKLVSQRFLPYKRNSIQFQKQRKKSFGSCQCGLLETLNKMLFGSARERLFIVPYRLKILWLWILHSCVIHLPLHDFTNYFAFYKFHKTTVFRKTCLERAAVFLPFVNPL